MSKTYLGVDVHKRFCVFTEIDAEGNLVREGDSPTTLRKYHSLPVPYHPGCS